MSISFRKLFSLSGPRVPQSFKAAGALACIIAASSCAPARPPDTRVPQSFAARARQASHFSKYLHRRVQVTGDERYYRLEQRMRRYDVPGLAVAIIDDGEVVWAKGYGVLQAGSSQKVDEHTVFSAASVSKVATAAMILKMSSEDLFSLDQSIEPQLGTWQLPKHRFGDTAAITLRMLLSHTAGLNLHGFADYAPEQKLPDIQEILNGEKPAQNRRLSLIHAPGSTYDYSGGGYTLAQYLVMERTQKSFPEAARKWLFEPLGMRRSSFENPLPPEHGNIARAHDKDGKAVALPRGYESMPEMAASGLWTSAHDLGHFVVALLRSYQGPGGYLPQSVALDMMTPIAPGQHGLGPSLQASNADIMFYHAGTNQSYKAWMEGHLSTQDGLVVLANGAGAGSLYVEIRNAVAEVMGWSINPTLRIDPLKLSPQWLSQFEGEYRFEDSSYNHQLRSKTAIRQNLRVYLDEQTLKVERMGKKRSYEMTPIAPDRFLLAGWNQRIGVVELQFHRDAFAKVLGVTFLLRDQKIFLPRQGTKAPKTPPSTP